MPACSPTPHCCNPNRAPCRQAGGAANTTSCVLVVAPPPLLEAGCLAGMFAGGAAKSRDLGCAIQSMCTRRGAGFFDAGSVIRVSPVDGIHYEAEAQVALGLAMAKHLRNHLT